MFTAQEAINRLSDKREIFFDEMVDLFRQVMDGKVTPVQLSAILMGLHVKTETVSEIAAAAKVMREFATKVDVGDLPNLVDTCGTGGDKAHTFNISTAAAFVAAAAGAKVAKHGGRSVSSQSGSADVLEALGGECESHRSAGGRVDQAGWVGLHVRANLSPRDEARSANQKRIGHAHDSQYSRAVDQPG